MENASKALIIAGAILLSILIIGLGMTIYQKASGAMNSANLDGTTVQTYNAEFENYKGTQTGTNARALFQLIENHNRTNQDDTSLQINTVVATTAVTTVTEKTDAEEPGTTAASGALKDIKAGYNYYVYFTYSKAGYITHCYITQLKK